MQITIFNNKLRTQSGIFVSHLLTLMKGIDRTKHTINFITLHPGPLSEEVLKVVNGVIVQFSLSKFLRLTSTLRKSDIVICRNYGTSFLALCIKSFTRGKFPIHADLRGIVLEEVRRYRQFPMNYILFAVSKLAERVIIDRSNSISCVSKPFQQYLVKNGGDPKKISVVPNGVDVTLHSFNPKVRLELRHKLNIHDHLVFVYCGSAQRWYCIEEMLRLFKVIHQKHRRSWLLILSKSTMHFQTLCSNIGVSNYSIYGLNPKQVPSYLMAADYAFLLRSDNVVTHVSSPIKFAEYVAAGNKVIITKNIGDSSRFVQEKNAGFQVNLSNPSEIIDQVISEVPMEEKNRIARLARTELNKNRILANFFTSLGL
jgi:glycosyltransferase involved in cell wall biosynthesis